MVRPPRTDTQPSRIGRERIPRRRPPLQARHLPRTNHRPRRIHLQSLQLTVHHQPQPEVFPNAREPQHEHGEEHRGEDLQFLARGERVDGLYGGAAGLCGAVLLSGREER